MRCHKRIGKWNSLEHSCVECNADHTRANLLAKESEKCFDYSCDGFGNCD